jgi:hypothetical protein
MPDDAGRRDLHSSNEFCLSPMIDAPRPAPRHHHPRHPRHPGRHLYSAVPHRQPRRPGQLALRRIFHRQHQQRSHATSLCPRLQPVLRLVRKSRIVAHGHSAVRRSGLGERPAADTRGAGCEAAAGGRAHAVRLAHYRADRTDEPGGGGARSQARRQDRQDAGARGRGMAQTARFDSDHDLARFATAP